MTAIPPSQAIFAGSSPNVTCVAEFDDTVDIPLMFMITFSTGNDVIKSDYSVQMESYMRYMKTFTIENITKSQEYKCAFTSPFSGLSALYILVYQNDIITASVNVLISE